jgi:hypothetical protein
MGQCSRMSVCVRTCVRASGFVVRELSHHRQKEAIRAIAVWCVDSQSCDRVVQREGEGSGVTGRLRWMLLHSKCCGCGLLINKRHDRSNVITPTQ